MAFSAFISAARRGRGREETKEKEVMRYIGILAGIGLLLAVTGTAGATTVDLTVEPATGTTVKPGDTFTLDVWARFAEAGQWNAADIVFEWDPAYIQLDGGTFNPAFSMAMWPSPPGGINDAWNDGDAGCSVVIFMSNITDDTRIITLELTALNLVDSTRFDIVLNAAAYSPGPTTMVIDPTTFLDCHRNLSGAEVKIVPEPVTMAGLMLGIGCLARYVRRRKV